MTNLSRMTEDQTQALRRLNLTTWLEKAGGAKRACAGRNLPPSYPSYLSQVVHGHSFASRGARTAEQRLGIPSGWLDIDHSGDKTDLSAPVIPQLGFDLAAALEVVGMALAADMPDPVREDVVDALAKLASRRGADRDQQRVLHLLNAPPAKRQSNG